MQYVRSLGGSVSKTWNSLNPATLSGAIDVIVVEQDDGSLACSPFHVRFGKFSLLRPYEKKVEFRVNDVKQDYSMKLGEGGEAFFVFETSEDVPESLQTSPVISPTNSPPILALAQDTTGSSLQEPEPLDLNANIGKESILGNRRRPLNVGDVGRAKSHLGALTPLSTSPARESLAEAGKSLQVSRSFPSMKRSASEEAIMKPPRLNDTPYQERPPSPDVEGQTTPSYALIPGTTAPTDRSISPPPISTGEAITRAKALSDKLLNSNINSFVTANGDLMLDMTGYKSREEGAFRAEIIARKVLAEELEGNYDIGALIGADEQGNLWIYSSEEAKSSALQKTDLHVLSGRSDVDDAISDPGRQVEGGADTLESLPDLSHHRTRSDAGPTGLLTPPKTPPIEIPRNSDHSRNYAKTLRLTSEQLQALRLKPGANSISFSVNRATCHAYMFYWKDDAPIVISDIDGTITKSDALGHVLNMIGRDWTHLGVAKLYTDITANGYHVLYLTSRSVGQADSTRTYLNGVTQEGYKLPRGPVIMSPDRTMAALRREIYLRKPEVFKMACLRDIRNLFSQQHAPFYAGFGNRLTDALSYRSVNIPSSRIFTINSEAEVSLDLLSLTKYKSSYVTMREVVDHFFPPVGLLVTGGGEDYTDFSYWRDPPIEIENFSDCDTDDPQSMASEKGSMRSEDERSDAFDDDKFDDMIESYLSYDSNLEPESRAQSAGLQCDAWSPGLDVDNVMGDSSTRERRANNRVASTITKEKLIDNGRHAVQHSNSFPNGAVTLFGS